MNTPETELREPASVAEQLRADRPSATSRLSMWGRLTPADRSGILAAVGVAAAMRLVLILSYAPQLSSDSHDYLELAHRLAGWDFTGWQARRTPVYSLLLLLVHYSLSATWWIQAGLGVLSTVLVYALIRILGGGSRAALGGAIVYGASLEVIAIERLILTESLTGFLMLAAAVICAAMIRRGVGLTQSRVLVAGAGATLLLLCLTRPDAFVAAAVLALLTAATLSGRSPSSTRRARARVLALGGAAMIAPAVLGLFAWASFNASTAGTFTASSVIGYNMIDHVGHYVVPMPGPDEAITTAYAAQVRRHAVWPSYAAIPEIERRTGLDPAHLSSRYLRIALRLALAHPLGYIGSSARQWVQAWRQPNYASGFSSGSLGTETDTLWSVERPVQILVCALFLVLCAAAVIARARSRRGPFGPGASVVAATAVIGTLMAAFVGYTDPGRYAYPYLSLVICVAFAGSGPMLQAARALRRRIG